jgi:hypothetical protein
MAIDLKSGNKIERTTIVDLQEQVSDGLNASIGQDDVSRAALGADQMYGGALCSSRQFEVLQGTIVEDHVKYPETWQGPYWGASIDWQTGSTPPTGPSASGPTFPGVNNAYERQRWQRIGGYESAGSVPGTAYGSDLHLLYELVRRIKSQSVVVLVVVHIYGRALILLLGQPGRVCGGGLLLFFGLSSTMRHLFLRFHRQRALVVLRMSLIRPVKTIVCLEM